MAWIKQQYRLRSFALPHLDKHLNENQADSTIGDSEALHACIYSFMHRIHTNNEWKGQDFLVTISDYGKGRYETGVNM